MRDGSMSHPDFPVVDSHVHLYPDPLALKVTPALASRFGNAPAFDGTVGGCIAKNATCGIRASLNLPVATKPDSVAGTNRFWADYAPSRSKCGVFSLASFHPQVGDKAAEVARIAEAGFAGIKFHPEYQLFRFNDTAMDDAWAAMSELGLVAYLHAGGERVFDPPYHSTPSDIATLQLRFPRLKIVAAHLGGFGMWNESEASLVGTSVHLDLSHTFFWMDNAQILRMIKAHGAERILFGSDSPWQDPGEVLEAFLKLPLSEQERRAICHTNACRLFSISDPGT